jgi:GT2 family glycosyltransferase
MAHIALPCSATPRASIHIVSARQPELLRRCLASLARYPSSVAFETVVVLNAALPEVRALVREQVSGGIVLESPVALGFAGALNRARAAARGEFLVLFHDDCEAEPGWLDALVSVADSHPEAGAVGSRMFFPDGAPQGRGAILWRDGTASTLGGRSETADGGAEITAVDYSGGASLLVRADTWDGIGGADERFYPAYYVDVDLCLGVWNLGQAVLCAPASRVRHHRGASSTAAFRQFLLRHNRQCLLQKWGTGLEAFEPRSGDRPADVQGAIAKAQARWRSVRAANNEPRAALHEAPFDSAAQERRVLEIALALERAWTAELTAQLERASAAREDETRAHPSKSIDRTLRRLKRAVAATVRRLTRPAAASRTE